MTRRMSRKSLPQIAAANRPTLAPARAPSLRSDRMRLSSTVLVWWAGWALASGVAQAAGFTIASANLRLGSPLSLSVLLQLDEADAAEPNCVSAEVSAGDRRVPANNVRWIVEPGSQPRERIVRVSTLTAVDEPLVAVQLTVGCNARHTRRFTFFAEPPPVVGTASAAAAAQDAANAASAAMGAASAASARAGMLEQQVERLLADARQQRADNEQLRSRLAAESWSHWMWVGLLIATLVGAVAWLAWRLRRVQRDAQAQWWKTAQADVMADLQPDPDDTQSQAATLGAPQRATNPSSNLMPTSAVAQSAIDRTADERPGGSELGLATITALRPVSAEELIDLEQQADFFVVLGQDDAAIDLLMEHIRGSGGISPLPYMKLLEIYKRRGEPETYERTRARFNQRFNAYAPDWDSDLQVGRCLEDDAEVIASLQRCWPTPLDAMADLEALLFRKDGGQLFDLPAYRELMLLYSMARDLHEAQPQAAQPVDLLLPLDAAPDREASAPVASKDVDTGPQSPPADLSALDALVRNRRGP